MFSVNFNVIIQGNVAILILATTLISRFDAQYPTNTPLSDIKHLAPKKLGDIEPQAPSMVLNLCVGV